MPPATQHKKSTTHLRMEKRCRKRLTAGEKLQILRSITEARAIGSSIKACCREFGIQPAQYRSWLKKRPDLIHCKKTKKSLHVGRVGLLKSSEEELVHWVLAYRDVGIPMSYKAICIKGAEIDRDFSSKSEAAQLSIIRRFCASNCLVVRATTHMAQRIQSETESEAVVFVRAMRPILQSPERRQNLILNMDQTPLWFSMTPKKTINLQGSRTVYCASTMGSTKRVTAAACVSAAGDKLKPFLIFKGEQNGRIATRELPNSQYRERMSLHCQKKAWMGQDEMEKWIHLILLPYLREKGGGVRPLLILDDYKVHKSEETKRLLEENGVDTYWIPGGCTSLAQPVDVGIGRPLKARFRRNWLDWVISNGIDVTLHQEPTREEVAGWAADAWDALSTDVCRNAWRKTGFSYFPSVTVEADEGDM